MLYLAGQSIGQIGQFLGQICVHDQKKRVYAYIDRE
jgi:hypothetical protein